MAERIPIIMTSSRKENFAQAHFELKVFALIFIVMTFAPFIFLLGPDNTSNIFWAIIIPGCSGLYAQGIIQCFRLTIGDQSLEKQLELRLYFILTLLLLIAFYYWQLPYLNNNHHLSTLLYQKVSFYRPLYNIDLPAFLILILLIRTIPMTVRFYILKRQKQLAV